MANPEAILQLARMLGRADFLGALGLEGGEEPAGLDAQQLARVRQLVDARIDALAGKLLEEAMASDDVTDPPSALIFLQDRLCFLGELLTDEQRGRLRERFEAAVAGWGC